MAQAGDSSSAETLEGLIRGKLKAAGVPGLSVVVVKGDRIVWRRGFGFADLATARPATPLTSYLWFSMTKIFTATAVMRLAEGGNLDVDAPADEYFRGFKIVSQPVPVTVRHILNHNSGLANPLPIRWVRSADAPVPEHRAFVALLLAKNRRLESVPGERARYSNLGYLVLGEGISEVSGVCYEEYVRGEILASLRMGRTGFSYPEPAGDGAATGYQSLWEPLTPLFRAALPKGVVGRRQGRYVAFNPFYVKGPAYGGLVGGVDEAARFVQLHLKGGEVKGVQLLSAESVAEMHELRPRVNPRHHSKYRMGVNLSQKTRYRRRKPDDPVNGLPEPKVRPIILTVDDERKDPELVERELRKRYEAAYHVACEGSVERDDLTKQGKTRIFSVVGLASPPQRPPRA